MIESFRNILTSNILLFPNSSHLKYQWHFAPPVHVLLRIRPQTTHHTTLTDPALLLSPFLSDKELLLLLTKRSCGKVMFSQMSVILHREGVPPWLSKMMHWDPPRPSSPSTRHGLILLLLTSNGYYSLADRGRGVLGPGPSLTPSFEAPKLSILSPILFFINVFASLFLAVICCYFS